MRTSAGHLGKHSTLGNEKKKEKENQRQKFNRRIKKSLPLGGSIRLG